MKDTIITAKRKKFEIIYLAICFTMAFILNIYAISSYHTSWNEIFSSLHFVLILTLVFYFVFSVIRLVIAGIKRISRKV